MSSLIDLDNKDIRKNLNAAQGDRKQAIAFSILIPFKSFCVNTGTVYCNYCGAIYHIRADHGYHHKDCVMHDAIKILYEVNADGKPEYVGPGPDPQKVITHLGIENYFKWDVKPDGTVTYNGDKPVNVEVKTEVKF